MKNSTPPWDSLSQAKTATVERPTVDRATHDRCNVVDLDPQLVSQTKSQIRDLVQAIAELAKSSLATESFFASFMIKAREAMMAEGIAIWLHRPSTSVSTWHLASELSLSSDLKCPRDDLVSEISTGQSTFEEKLELQVDALEHSLENNLSRSGDRSSSDSHPPIAPSLSHRRILDAVAKEKQPVLIPPRSVPMPGGQPPNPVEELLILSPVPCETEEGTYWLEVVQRPQGGPATQRGYLRFVAQLADFVADHFRANQVRVMQQERSFHLLAEKLLTRIAMNDPADSVIRDLLLVGRDRLHATQVMLVSRKTQSKTWQVRNVSGSDAWDHRSHGIENVCALVQQWQSTCRDNALDIESLALDADDERLSACSECMQLFKSTKATWISLPVDARVKKDCVALIVFHSKHLDSSMEVEHQRFQSLALLAMRGLRLDWWMKWCRVTIDPPSLITRCLPWNWGQTTKIVASLALFGILALIPIPIQIITTATLRPLHLQHVYAQSDAVVSQVHVDHGMQLKTGMPLLELDDHRLRALIDEHIDHKARVDQRLKDVHSARMRRDQLKPEERDQLESERKALEQQLQNLAQRWTILSDQENRLKSVANIDGVVSTWDAKRALQDRPVRTGQLLMTLHQPEGPWCLVADIQERDLPLWRQAMIESSAVDGYLTSHPNLLMQATLHEVDSQLYRDHAQHGKSTLRARFLVDPRQLPIKTDGAAARVHIRCGKAPLVWVLSRDILLSTWAKIRLWI